MMGAVRLRAATGIQLKAVVVVKSTSPARTAQRGLPPAPLPLRAHAGTPHPAPRTPPLYRADWWRPCRPRPTTRALAALADHHHRGRHHHGAHCQRAPPPLSAPLSPRTVGPADRCGRRRRTSSGERDKSNTVAQLLNANNCRVGRGVCQPASAGAWGIVSSVVLAVQTFLLCTWTREPITINITIHQMSVKHAISYKTIDSAFFSFLNDVVQ